MTRQDLRYDVEQPPEHEPTIAAIEEHDHILIIDVEDSLNEEAVMVTDTLVEVEP